MYMHGSVCDAGCTRIPDTHCAGVIGGGIIHLLALSTGPGSQQVLEKHLIISS